MLQAHKFNVSSNTITKYVIYAVYSVIGGLMVLPDTNPIFKICLATYVGLSTIILILYGFIIYFKSVSNSQYNGDQHKQGFIGSLLNFIPNMIQKFSILLIQLFLIGWRLFNKKSINIDSLVLAYFLVNLRKMVALVCWCYITENDDNSLHEKAFLVFCFLNLIQHSFIVKSDPKTNTGKVQFMDGLKSFVKVGKNAKIEKANLRFRRNILLGLNFSLMVYLFVSMFKFYWEFDSDYSIAIPLLNKLLLLIDMEFLKTLCFEMNGIQFTFKNVDFSIV